MSVNLHYEDKARSAGFSSVCGVDEAGAVPLMGLCTPPPSSCRRAVRSRG